MMIFDFGQLAHLQLDVILAVAVLVVSALVVVWRSAGSGSGSGRRCCESCDRAVVVVACGLQVSVVAEFKEDVARSVGRLQQKYRVVRVLVARPAALLLIFTHVALEFVIVAIIAVHTACHTAPRVYLFQTQRVRARLVNLSDASRGYSVRIKGMRRRSEAKF